jgi:hypothetical protein
MRFFTKIVLALLSATTVSGGIFTNDFSNPSPTNFTLNGAAAITNGELVLTPKAGGQGGVVLDDLDAGAAIESFTANFKVRFTPTTFYPADGLFFSFGPGVSFPVEGPGSSAMGVEFDTYDNSAPDNVGIDVKVVGQEIATTVMAVNDLADGRFHDVLIQLNRNGTLNVTWDSRIIYNNLFLANWSPVAGQFAFGHSTGYFLEECDIKKLGISTTAAGAATGPTITAQPAPSVSLIEGSPLALRIGFDGSAPLSFQWNLNSNAIPNATDPVLQIANVPLTNGNITCTISSAAGQVTSHATTLTVTRDSTPLTIQSVVGSDTLRAVTVTFSKPVLDTTAQTPTNYSIAGLTISAAGPFTKPLTPWSSIATNDARQVVLTTTPQTPGAAYTLVVNNVQDQTSAGNIIAANSQKTFHAFSYLNGYMSYDIYDNQGVTAGSLPQFESSFTNLVPTRTLLFTSADTPDWEYGGNYGSISQGLILAPETGSYIFHVASDDQSELFLSRDATPAKLNSICQVTTWSLHLDWAGAGMGAPDTTPGTGNRSLRVNLVQGQKYYFRDFHVEGTGGDGISIGWELPSSPGTISVIPGTNLMALVNTDVSPVPTLSISPTSTGITIITITFTGVLQSADVVTGPWMDEPTASPLVLSPIAAIKFYRARAGE